MPKIDLTGRVNGDFVVIKEYSPTYNDSGKKQLRWLCECQTCHEKEVVKGENIRRNQHKFCTACLFEKYPDDARIAEINKLLITAGREPITQKQYIKMYKRVIGVLPEEEYDSLPNLI